MVNVFLGKVLQSDFMYKKVIKCTELAYVFKVNGIARYIKNVLLFRPTLARTFQSFAA
jgi:hypothetical protein